ncbi:MAG: amino acid adenylation domain-containing protein [Clostridiales bacterium]|jgi:amino acid adenylation domain-containing protein|nr:amino acid adenylation domain-containing protein [Clostridiales bacterium]
MRGNILEYLENTAADHPGNVAFEGEFSRVTFAELLSAARSVGSALAGRGVSGAVAVWIPKSPETIAAFLGVLYAGAPYCPLDDDMPAARVAMILEKLRPRVIIADASHRDKLSAMGWRGEVLDYAEAARAEVDETALSAIRARRIDTDAAFIVFTSGSTGVPKGVVGTHRAVIGYIDALTDILDINSDTVFGNQTPLYVDACLKDIITTLKTGARCVFLPKGLFMFPARLIEFMESRGVNTICWVAYALVIVSSAGALATPPKSLRTIAFGSEVLPAKHLTAWRAAFPSARFFNLYGPTEVTGISVWHEVKRDYAPGEAIPIGKPFPNYGAFLVKNGAEVTEPGREGYIHLRGAAVSPGYYRDAERTSKSFIQNPLRGDYPEIVYNTGDIGKYNADGDLVYVCRDDFQIKRRGYRVELTEIERIAAAADGVKAVACVYSAEGDRLTLFYVGDGDERSVRRTLRSALPPYMNPNEVRRLAEMPLTGNQKTDRLALAALVQ